MAAIISHRPRLRLARGFPAAPAFTLLERRNPGGVVATEVAINPHSPRSDRANPERAMDSIIYLVGLIVVVMFILSALGLR
jgi:hypothetical protein